MKTLLELSLQENKRIHQVENVKRLNLDNPGVDSELRDGDRLHETTQVCGSTIKEIIHEMFGNSIMSAIDFEIDIQKEEDPRVIA